MSSVSLKFGVALRERIANVRMEATCSLAAAPIGPLHLVDRQTSGSR